MLFIVDHLNGALDFKVDMLSNCESTLSFKLDGEDARESREGVSEPALGTLEDDPVAEEGIRDAYDRKRET